MDIGKLGFSALEEKEEGAFIPSDSFEFEGILFPATLADREAVGGKVVSEESFSKLSSESLVLMLQLKLEQDKAADCLVQVGDNNNKLGEVVKTAFPELSQELLGKVLAFSRMDRKGLFMAFPSNHARAWFEVHSGKRNPSLAYQVDNNLVVVTKK
jgi:hypothetical protein